MNKYGTLLLLGSLILILLTVTPGYERLQSNRTSICVMKQTIAREPCGFCLDPLLSSTNGAQLTLQERLHIGRFASCLDDPALVVDLLSPIPVTGLDTLSSYSLAMSYIRLGEWTAIPELINPDTVPASQVVDWAVAAFNQDNIDEAKLWLSIASAYPAEALDWSTQRWLGFLWMKLSDETAKPIEYLEYAYDTAPDQLHVILLLAVAHRASENFGRAIDLLLTAVEMSPGNPQLMKELAITYRARGTAEDLAKLIELRDQAEYLFPQWQEQHPHDVATQRWWQELDVKE